MLNKAAMEKVESEILRPICGGLFQGLYERAAEMGAGSAETVFSFVDEDAVDKGEWVPEIVLRVRQVDK